jgi:hypothetical protein
MSSFLILTKKRLRKNMANSNHPTKLYLSTLPNPKIRAGIWRVKANGAVILGLITEQVLEQKKNGEIEVIQRS